MHPKLEAARALLIAHPEHGYPPSPEDIQADMLAHRMTPKTARTSTIPLHIDNGHFGTGTSLLCPSCDCDNLHHVGMISYDRVEDAKVVTKTTVSRGVTSTRHMLNEESDNPSMRRDGVSVQFWCEQCQALPELTLEQHKGTTYLNWRY